ncbi:hypothetical protein AB3R30_06595 [Leptolyngbyaceae cyanobacterium UHCC 1019]
MKNFYHQDWLLRFASKVFKYFLLSLFGLLIAFLFFGIVGFMPLITLLMALLEQYFMKFAIIVLCIVGVAVVMESIQ